MSKEKKRRAEDLDGNEMLEPRAEAQLAELIQGQSFKIRGIVYNSGAHGETDTVLKFLRKVWQLGYDYGQPS